MARSRANGVLTPGDGRSSRKFVGRGQVPKKTIKPGIALKPKIGCDDPIADSS